MAECLECGKELGTSNVVVGEVIECPDCGVELEVKSLNPLTIDHAPQELEDWGE